jgi:Glycosyl transferases group 1
MAIDTRPRRLVEENAALAAALAATRNELALIQGSIAWRATRPLRQLASSHPALAAPVRTAIRASRSARLRAVAQRAKTLLRLRVMAKLPGRAASRRATPDHAGVTATRAPTDQPSQARPVFKPCAIPIDPSASRSAGLTRGRLLCVTHVVPYPPRAGNEYRVDQMLNWLAADGWDILLVVCPPPQESVTAHQIAELATRYPNLIVCQRDGTLVHHLRDGGAIVDGLRGRATRPVDRLLGEHKEMRPDVRSLNVLLQTICPDVLIELLLHLEQEFKPHVLLAEYVFMTRGLSLLRTEMLKVVDSIDVFSTKRSKVEHFGIEDGLALEPEQEAELLDRTDLIIAIQPAEADALQKLAPRRRVISVGVDFKLVDAGAAEPPATEPIVLLVGSGNPLNVKGLKDFLRFAWPLVLAAVPEAELRVVGSVGEAVDPVLPNVRVLGKVGDLSAEYGAARMVINPTIAGTGLKIKTVEALSQLRPIVLWPAGVDGLSSEVRAFCRVADNWFEFARQVIELLSDSDNHTQEDVTHRRSVLAAVFAPETVYAPLRAALGRAARP